MYEIKYNFKMIKSTHTFRVRYAETDKMGFVYYGNYATFFEVARVELFRSIGVNYKELEDENVLLPVSEFSINYFKPLFYDEEFVVKTTIKELPSATRIIFDYQIINSKNEITTQATTTLFFMNKINAKPIKCPEKVLEKMEIFFR